MKLIKQVGFFLQTVIKIVFQVCSHLLKAKSLAITGGKASLLKIQHAALQCRVESSKFTLGGKSFLMFLIVLR